MITLQSTFNTRGCWEIQLNFVKTKQVPLKGCIPRLGAKHSTEILRTPPPALREQLGRGEDGGSGERCRR